LAFDPNPNAAQGYDAPEITQRSAQLTLDPKLVAVATRNTIKAMQDGVEYIVMSIAGKANDIGNRVAFTAGRCVNTNTSDGDRQNLAVESLTFAVKGSDNEAYICIF